MKIRVNSESSLEECISQLKSQWEEHKYLEVEFFKGKRRTSVQNRALHKWFGMLADTLNEAGYDMKKTLKPEVEIAWTPESIKEYLWRPVQKALTKKESTTECKTVEFNEVYETLCRYLSDKLGITPPPWPQKENHDGG